MGWKCNKYTKQSKTNFPQFCKNWEVQWMTTLLYDSYVVHISSTHIIQYHLLSLIQRFRVDICFGPMFFGNIRLQVHCYLDRDAIRLKSVYPFIAPQNSVISSYLTEYMNIRSIPSHSALLRIYLESVIPFYISAVLNLVRTQRLAAV